MNFFKKIKAGSRTTPGLDAGDAVDAAYRALMGRKPDPEGRAYYLDLLRTGRASLEGVLLSLVKSSEFRARALRLHLSADNCSIMQSGDGEGLLRDLRGGKVSWQEFEEMWEELIPPREQLVIGQEEYLRVHKRRFYELANAVKTFLPEGGSICEFGVSEFSRFYKSLCPKSFLVTADRPAGPDYPGFTPERCRRIAGCDMHFSIDLENRKSSAWEELRSAGPFDLVIFAEVLEHLLAEPVELAGDLVSLLSHDGILYITTPDFLRSSNIEEISEGRNPQPFYPGAAENWDAHYHFREYTMKELAEVLQQAGARVAAAYFSDCWDVPADEECPDVLSQGSDIVVAASRQ